MQRTWVIGFSNTSEPLSAHAHFPPSSCTHVPSGFTSFAVTTTTSPLEILLPLSLADGCDRRCVVFSTLYVVAINARKLTSRILSARPTLHHCTEHAIVIGSSSAGTHLRPTPSLPRSLPPAPSRPSVRITCTIFGNYYRLFWERERGERRSERGGRERVRGRDREEGEEQCTSTAVAFIYTFLNYASHQHTLQFPKLTVVQLAKHTTPAYIASSLTNPAQRHNSADPSYRSTLGAFSREQLSDY